MTQQVKQYEKPTIRRMIVTDNPVCIQSNNTLESKQPIQFDNCPCPVQCTCMCDYPCACPSVCSCPSPCSCPCGSVCMPPTSLGSMLESIVSTNQPLKLKPSFRIRKENFGGLLYDSMAMSTYVLNKAAVEVIDLVKVESLPKRIIKILGSAYNYPIKTVSDDFKMFIGTLLSMGALIEYNGMGGPHDK